MEKQELIDEAKHIMIKLQPKINLKDGETFGTEIEFEHCSIQDVEKKVAEKLENWTVAKDGSLIFGAEIISPILTDNKQTWEDLTTACNIGAESGQIYVYSNAGGHIHYGSQIFKNNISYLINFLELWAAFEDIIFRFSAGDYINQRETVTVHAKSCKKQIEDALTKNPNKQYRLEEIKPTFQLFHLFAINTTKIKSLDYMENSTIEIRSPNGTLEPVIWQNNIKFFGKLLEYAASDAYDKELIQILGQDTSSQINIEKAYVLAQLIFDNDLDKLYFLRQYIKDGKQTKEKKLIKSENFIHH